MANNELQWPVLLIIASVTVVSVAVGAIVGYSVISNEPKSGQVCTDSDAGTYFGVPGIVTLTSAEGTRTFHDTCLTGVDEGKLQEGVCFGSNYKTTLKRCRGQCVTDTQGIGYCEETGM